jgi:hypothetical protein
VLTFNQGDDEGIDEAWDRFNELLERGPNLGFSGDLMLHLVYFSLTLTYLVLQACVQVVI